MPEYQIYSRRDMIEATVTSATHRHAAMTYFDSNPEAKQCWTGVRGKPAQCYFSRNQFTHENNVSAFEKEINGVIERYLAPLGLPEIESILARALSTVALRNELRGRNN